MSMDANTDTNTNKQPAPQPITAEMLKDAALEMVFHLRMGRGGFMQQWRCKPYPQLVVTKTRVSSRSAVETKMFVNNKEIPYGREHAAVALNALLIKPKPACRVCGCTEDRACLDEATGFGCHWVEDDLCNVCQRAAS